MSEPFYLTEPIDNFFGLFAEECSILNSENSFSVIFDETPQDAEGFNAKIAGTEAFLRVQNKDLLKYPISKTTILVIRDQWFTMRELKYNANGVSILELEKFRN